MGSTSTEHSSHSTKSIIPRWKFFTKLYLNPSHLLDIQNPLSSSKTGTTFRSLALLCTDNYFSLPMAATHCKKEMESWVLFDYDVYIIENKKKDTYFINWREWVTGPALHNARRICSHEQFANCRLKCKQRRGKIFVSIYVSSLALKWVLLWYVSSLDLNRVICFFWETHSLVCYTSTFCRSKTSKIYGLVSNNMPKTRQLHCNILLLGILGLVSHGSNPYI